MDISIVVLIIVIFSIMSPNFGVGGSDSTRAKIEESSASKIAEDEVRKGKVLGGIPTVPGEYPWIVSIKWLHGSHFCGGFILDERHVVSAAHCFIDSILRRIRSPSTFEVTVGEHRLTLNGGDERREKVQLSGSPSLEQDMSVLSVLVHPAYDRKSKMNDIALIRLQHNITWNTRVQPAKPLLENFSGQKKEDYSYEGKEGIVAGWGWSDGNSLNLSKELRKVKIPIWRREKCARVIGQHSRISSRSRTDKQLCAGGIKTQDSCAGDSGSPLMVEHEEGTGNVQVVGIVSGGLDPSCGTPGLPGLYTRLSHYMDWIENARGS